MRELSGKLVPRGRYFTDLLTSIIHYVAPPFVAIIQTEGVTYVEENIFVQTQH